MAMGLIWLLVEAFEGLTDTNVKLPYWLFLVGSFALGTIVCAVDGYFVAGFLRYKITICSNSFDTKILIKFGDLFAQEGWKAISVNDFFDNVVDDQLVSSYSLHGEAIMRYWHGDGARWQEQVYGDLHNVQFELVSRPKGNQKRYRIGTTARASSGNNDFLFVALGKTDTDTNVTHATPESLITAVRGLLAKARSVCANRTLNMPLIGSGLSRVGIKNAVLVHLILSAIFEETKISKVTETIVLVLPKEKTAEIDLGEILRNWR